VGVNSIRIDFDVLVNSLSLDFGNDDNALIPPDIDKALLTVFKNGVEAGKVFVIVNGNNIIDQTISFSGADFNSALFAYTDPNKINILSLTEVIDNVSFVESATLDSDNDGNVIPADLDGDGDVGQDDLGIVVGCIRTAPSLMLRLHRMEMA